MALRRYTNQIIIIIIIIIKDPEGFWKKIDTKEKIVGVTITPSSPHEQKNRAAERCYIAARARKRAAWNKNAVSRSSPECWLIFFARSERKSEADSLIGPRISTAIG